MLLFVSLCCGFVVVESSLWNLRCWLVVVGYLLCFVMESLLWNICCGIFIVESPLLNTCCGIFVVFLCVFCNGIFVVEWLL